MTSRFCVIRRVRLPSTSHASNAPKNELPTTIHRALSPNPQPIFPANPINTTAEKYVVPYANADIQGPMLRPPRKNSPSVVVRRIPHTPTEIMNTRKQLTKMIDIMKSLPLHNL